MDGCIQGWLPSAPWSGPQGTGQRAGLIQDFLGAELSRLRTAMVSSPELGELRDLCVFMSSDGWVFVGNSGIGGFSYSGIDAYFSPPFSLHWAHGLGLGVLAGL